MKTRSGDKKITKENKDKARELLNKLGIKPTIEVIIPPVAVTPTPVAAPKTPPSTKPFLIVIPLSKSKVTLFCENDKVVISSINKYLPIVFFYIRVTEYK